MSEEREQRGVKRIGACRIPTATYRLQFNNQFTFDQASEIIGYLYELGVSDVYASPLFQASAESTHGYDVCDYGGIHEGLGGSDRFDNFATVLQRHRMGLLLDVVPNHMRADISNRWWADVLKKGRNSKYANWFDIDWDPPDPGLRDKVLLPVLEDEVEAVVKAGKLQLLFECGEFFIGYYNNRFPVALESLATTRADLVLQEYNAGTERIGKMNALLSEQHYRLTYWKNGLEQINYRRFFDVSSLVCLNAQIPEVFEACHRFLGCLLRERKVTGIRVDHPDGLWDPKEYFDRLQGLLQPHGSTYVVAEKILSGEEKVRRNWPVAGTTGYDFLNAVNGLFVDGDCEAAMDQAYGRFSGDSSSYEAAVERGKRAVLERSFQSEIATLAHTLQQIASGDGFKFELGVLKEVIVELVVALPVYRTYVTECDALPSEEDALVVRDALAVAEAKVSEDQRTALAFLHDILLLHLPHNVSRRAAIRFVMKFQQLTGPAMAKGLEDTAFYSFNRLVSLNEVGGEPGRFGRGVDEFHNHNQLKVEHWPHSLLATATHDTKRGEDARARINVLSEFPDQWESAVNRWATINAPCKRVSGDVQAPDRNDEYLFYQALIGAAPFAAATIADARFRERISAYMLKAIRESKTHTSWTEQNSEYENATSEFIENVLNGSNRQFISDFAAFHRPIAFLGQFNSYAQALLKITSPGVPDFYQGTELWDFNLVDPDNRRPVDYNVRTSAFANLKSRCDQVPLVDVISEALREPESGEFKLFITWKALNFRRAHPQLFLEGTYLPISSAGKKSKHLVAFARESDRKKIIVLVPRLIAGLVEQRERHPTGTDVWGDTSLIMPEEQPQRFRNAFTGEQLHSEAHEGVQSIRVAAALRTTPVALLERIPD
jgi:(1->4)-alpha-D-glucan 1-alpha-D-glucosylmutase